MKARKIINELKARNDRSAWDKGVTLYAIELAESLEEWGKEPKDLCELKRMLLNGAGDWSEYSWGGCALIYNVDIAERLCSPSQIRRCTNRDGLRDYANAHERWLDIQARALIWASHRVVDVARKYM